MQVEHVAADDGRGRGGGGERTGPQHAVRLHHDVVVHQHCLVDVAVLGGLVQAPGEPTGPAKVVLLDQVEAATQPGGRLGESRVRGHLVGALIDHVDPGDQVEHGRVLAECQQSTDAVVRPVERRRACGQFQQTHRQ